MADLTIPGALTANAVTTLTGTEAIPLTEDPGGAGEADGAITATNLANSVFTLKSAVPFTSADETKLDGIETAADVTDATNVNAAGAVMEADYNANTILAATSDNTPAAITVAEQRLVGRVTSGNIAALTGTQARTIVASAVDTNAETGSFTFALADAGLWTTISSISATTATVPPNSSVAFPVGTILTLEQISTGACTWTAGSGVTINVISTKTKVTNGQYAVSFARKTATDTWTVYGDLVAA